MTQERQQKKEQFTQQQKNGKARAVIALIVLILVAGFSGWLLSSSDAGSAALKSVAGEVRIDLATVSDGQAHYFTFATSKGDIKFFVVKSIDGEMRAAFDACDVCFREKKGYRQEGDFMVCNNCGQKFRTDLVNEVKGGCNPAPLQRRVDGKQLVMAEADIVSGMMYFGG